MVCLLWESLISSSYLIHSSDRGEAGVFALENWSALAVDASKDAFGLPLASLNVGTGKDLSIRQLAEQIAAVVGFQGRIEWDTSKPDGTPRKQLDVSRLQTWVGERPSLLNGI